MTSPNIMKFLAALDDFLVESFEVVEFTRLIERTFGAVVAELPSPAESRRSFMSNAVRVLARRGLLDGQFFAALAHDRPHRHAEIRRLAEILRIPVAIDGPDAETVVWNGAASPTAQAARLVWVESLERLLLTRERMALGEDRRADIERAIDGLARRLRSSPNATPGALLAGTRLERVLGTGNFGTVWRARHLQSGQFVATKVFNPDRLTDGIMLWRFRRSIRALQTLNKHRDAPPSIPQIIDVAPDTLSFAMPYLAEGTLEHLDRRGWSLATKLQIFIEVCRAVDFSHRIGVIHRDIKPANVLLDDTLRPVLVDYDIADIRFVTELPAVDGGLGTPVFAAPEQLESADAADERSDIYSLGRLFYYMLLERSPGYQIERDPSLDNLRGLQPALLAVVRRATQWDPRRRYSTVKDLIADLERHQTGFASLRARLANGRRWVRNHASLLITSLSVTGASISIALEQHQQVERHRNVIAEVETIQVEARRSLHRLAEGKHDLRELNLALRALEDIISGLNEKLRDLPEGVLFRASFNDLTVRARTLRMTFGSLASELESGTASLQAADAKLERALAGATPAEENAEQPLDPDTNNWPYDRSLGSQQARREFEKSSEPGFLVNAAPRPDSLSERPLGLPLAQTSRRRRSYSEVPSREPPSTIALELKKCDAYNFYGDTARAVYVRVTVEPDGTSRRWQPSHEIQPQFRACIDAVLREARFPPSLKGEMITFRLLKNR